MSYAEELRYLKQVITSGGVRAALRYLNQHAGVRYRALYLFDDDTWHSLYFVDRDDPSLGPAGGHPRPCFLLRVRAGVGPAIRH